MKCLNELSTCITTHCSILVRRPYVWHVKQIILLLLGEHANTRRHVRCIQTWEQMDKHTRTCMPASTHKQQPPTPVHIDALPSDCTHTYTHTHRHIQPTLLPLSSLVQLLQSPPRALCRSNNHAFHLFPFLYISFVKAPYRPR